MTNGGWGEETDFKNIAGSSIFRPRQLWVSNKEREYRRQQDDAQGKAVKKENTGGSRMILRARQWKKRIQEAAGWSSGQGSEEREYRRWQDDPKAKAAKKENTGGSRMMIRSRQRSICQRLTKKEMTGSRQQTSYSSDTGKLHFVLSPFLRAIFVDNRWGHPDSLLRVHNL